MLVTNNLRSDKPKTVKKKMGSLINEIKDQDPNVKIAISSVLIRKDSTARQNSVVQVNKLLRSNCLSNNIDFICNDNVNDQCLYKDGLHLNPRGVFILASNLKHYIHEI